MRARPNSSRGGPRGLWFLLAAALAAIPAFAPRAAAAPGTVYATRASVDWVSRVLTVDVELDLAAAGLRLPEGRLAAERMIDRDLGALAKDAAFALQVDSRRTLEDAVADGTFDPDKLLALVDLARVERSSFSKDMRKFVAVCSLRLNSVAGLFLSGAAPSPIRAPLEERPTRDYTGIVIYAKGSLPVHGERTEGRAGTCLFPRVYDSGMSVVLDRSLVLPEALAEGGVLGYASALGAAAAERVGGDPMRVMAVELFGDDRSDIVIAREDALRILSSSGNRELLRRGRVVVVLDL